MPAAHYVLDTETKRETLAGADALAQANGRPLEDHQDRRAVRLDPGASVLLEVPLPRADLSGLNQLSVEIATAPGVQASAQLQLILSSRTAGLPHPDSFNSGHAETFTSEAWREYLFPYENFLIYGTPEKVAPVEKALLRIGVSGGTVWVGALHGALRKRAVGSRMTDEGLLAALDLERPELREVREAAEGKRTDEALAALLRHLKNRAAPRHIFGRPPADEAPPNLPEAERILENVINGFPVGSPVNWRANPNGYLEWMHAFNRTFFFMILLRAYQKTGEEKFARKLDELFAGWIAANPEPVGHNGGGDPAWETLSTACRIYGSWLECFFALLSDSNFRDATRLAILKSFHGHAEHLMKYQGGGNNWLVVESRVLAVLGMLFPEFQRAGAWDAEGFGRLGREIERQIFPDGADWEFAPGYHMMAVSGFLDTYEIARLNGRAVPPLFEERLPKTFEYIAGMTRPDGTLPSVNDSGGYRSRSGKKFLARGARLFERPELCASPEGPFAGRSRAFPDAGFHVLASGTGRAARWLLFDGGPFGAAHQHEDALSIELFALGVPFLVDPGISSYLHDHWTAFYRQTQAHSTLLVNDAGQNRRAVTRHHHAESARGKVRAVLGPVFDWLSAEYRDGYHGQPAGLAHRRSILFVRGAYYVVLDEVSGEGAQSLEALFHFTPMRVELEARTHRVRTMRLKGPNLEIIPLEPRQGLKAKLACGAADPVQGWVADAGEDLPAPVASFALRGRPPLRFAAALVPYGQGVNAGVKIARLPKLPPHVMGVKLSFADGRADRIWLRHEPEARLPGRGAPLDADVKVERFDARGRRTASAWMLGKTMTVET